MSEKSTRILIVEDSRTDWLLIRQVMLLVQEASYEIEHADGVHAALERLSTESFDVCFVDYMLEDGNGLDLITQAKQMPSPPPFIMLTSNNSREIDLKAAQAGADDYVCKSAINPCMIERSIRYARERHRTLESLKAANDEIRRKDEALQQKQKLESIGSLAGGVAHEFNNLLQAIQGYTRFAQRGLKPDEQRFQDLDQVLKATDRAAALTKQLLAFSREDQFAPRPVHVDSALHDLAAMLNPVIGTSVDLQLAPVPHLPPVLADPMGLHQVLLNLCINARDAMPDGGSVFISVRETQLPTDEPDLAGNLPEGQYIEFSVTDSGTGIEPETLNRIFDPFFTTKDVGKGTGLGLAMVHGFVQQHGGSIRVDTEVGEGTAFRILLPVASSEVESVPETIMPALSENGENVSGNGETVLVVDDEPSVRDVATRLLKEAGYRVLTAENGQEAVAVFRQHRDEIALTLLDVMMPVMNGRQAMAEIRRMVPDASILFCSGHSSKERSAFGSAEGEPSLIHKPCNPQELVRAVHEHLRSARATDQPVSAAGCSQLADGIAQDLDDLTQSAQELCLNHSST